MLARGLGWDPLLPPGCESWARCLSLVRSGARVRRSGSASNASRRGERLAPPRLASQAKARTLPPRQSIIATPRQGKDPASAPAGRFSRTTNPRPGSTAPGVRQACLAATNVSAPHASCSSLFRRFRTFQGDAKLPATDAVMCHTSGGKASRASWVPECVAWHLNRPAYLPAMRRRASAARARSSSAKSLRPCTRQKSALFSNRMGSSGFMATAALWSSSACSS